MQRNDERRRRDGDVRLTCTDGDTTRTKGTARLNGAKLEVSWDGFGKDEFSRNTTRG
ncbi:hypothetical protein [Streptomyces sp. NPDC048111]|uniref:hypothetical protein n=1 Tax=Streptomyces sp. NPDC048111 TaxID=3365500 RepID=UPI003710CD3D